jgi:transcriptional regulator with XRE-family HTH domain
MTATEFGAFLASRRARIQPSDVGLPTGPRRRVPGLRRDEVATLAGASVDYYTELEQGRGAHPSAQMLAALARALRLSTDERDHLFHLAGQPAPPAGGGAGHAQPAMLALLDRLPTTPARIITDLDETLAQNRMAAALLGEPHPGTGPAASFVYRWFTDPGARDIYPVEDHARTRGSSPSTCARRSPDGGGTRRRPPWSAGCGRRARSSPRCGTAGTSRSGGRCGSGSCTRRSV